MHSLILVGSGIASLHSQSILPGNSYHSPLAENSVILLRSAMIGPIIFGMENPSTGNTLVTELDSVRPENET